MSGGLVFVRSLVQPDPLPGYRHEPDRQMLHECQMEDYVETTIFLQPLVWFTQKSQSLETGPCACPGSSQRRQACVDVRSECWTAVCVAMQCVSVGDHFAVNCTFSFPGSGLSPCLVERGTDGVICSMLS